MKRQIPMWKVLFIIAIVIILTFLSTLFFSVNIFNDRVFNVQEKEKLYNKISEVDNLIKKYYVDEISNQDLSDNSVSGLVSGLHDRYSRYLDKEQMQDYMNSTNGQMVGIGITVKLNDQGFMEIISIYEGSPAKEAGLEKGDTIIKIDGKDIKGLGYQNAVGQIRGKEGSYANMTFRRGTEEFSKSIQRKKIVLKSVIHDMIGNIGYIRIDEFNQSTTDQFKTALSDVISKNAKSLIFDVRGNPGGTLDSVVSVLDILLPEGPIVSATYKGGRTEVLANSDNAEINLPMVVLADGNTASAGELFTAALKDYDKARVVGKNTFGKGVMQTLIPLSDGTGVNLTTAYFNPPKSGNFNTKGIAPDIEVELNSKLNPLEYNLNTNMDDQLKKAVEVLS